MGMGGACVKKPGIMIVEDEFIVAFDIKQRLEARQYEVHSVVTTGEEAVKRASNSPPDLILMDISLAGVMDGIQAAIEIRKRNDIPVIYITAFADPTTTERASRSGPYGYLNKPVNPLDLFTCIESALERNRLDRLLRRSEERYRRLIEEISDVVFALDENGIVTYVSPVITEVTGHAPGQVLGRPFTELVHPEDLAPVVKRFNLKGSKPEDQIEFRITHVAGGYVWVRCSARAVFATRGFEGFRGTIQDITTRRHAQDMFRKVFARNPVPMAITGVGTGAFLDVNDAFLDALGYGSGELTGKNASASGVFPEPGALESIAILVEEQGAVRQHPVLVRTKERDTMQGSLSADMILIDGQKYLLAIFEGITAARFAQHENCVRR